MALKKFKVTGVSDIFVDEGGGGGFGTPTSIKTSDYNAVNGDLVTADPTGGPFNVFAPPAPAIGDVFTVSNFTGSVNVVTVVFAGGQQSFGDTSVDIPAFTTVSFEYIGSNEWVRA